MVAQVRLSDATAAEWAIVFLEVDPWCYRSGYFKESLLQALQALELNGDQTERLRAVVLHHVDVGFRREFRFTIKLAKNVRDRALVDALKARLLGADAKLSVRALWVLMGLKRVRFGEDEVMRARQLALEFGADESNFSAGDHWLRRVAIRFGSAE